MHVSHATSASHPISFTCVHPPYVSIRQHTSAYGSIRRHTSAYVSTRQQTSANVSIHKSAPHCHIPPFCFLPRCPQDNSSLRLLPARPATPPPPRPALLQAVRALALALILPRSLRALPRSLRALMLPLRALPRSLRALMLPRSSRTLTLTRSVLLHLLLLLLQRLGAMGLRVGGGSHGSSCWRRLRLGAMGLRVGGGTSSR
jgi:hypothetical protein